MTTSESDLDDGGLEGARRTGQTVEPAGQERDLEDLPRVKLSEPSSEVLRDLRGDR